MYLTHLITYINKIIIIIKRVASLDSLYIVDYGIYYIIKSYRSAVAMSELVTVSVTVNMVNSTLCELFPLLDASKEFRK